MELIICMLVSFAIGYPLGVFREKKRCNTLIRESYYLGYKECDKKWQFKSAEEIRRKIERRKTNHEN